MLVGFLGAPCSGKTTTAARVFAELKDLGIPSEFVTEKARTFIAYKRLDCMDSGMPFTLTDEDQMTIAFSQRSAEKVMKASGNGGNVVVTDSASFNSAIYMSDDYLGRQGVRQGIQNALREYTLLFFCPLVPRPTGIDPNRVHTQAQSEELQARLHNLLQEFETPEIVTLLGESRGRVQEAMSIILHRMVGP